MGELYFDWAASAPCDSDALASFVEVSQKYFANPSSSHPKGREAHKLLQEARNQCASLLSVPPTTVTFTSGGSEGNNLVLTSFLRKRQKYEILSTPIEHTSVINPLYELKNAGAHQLQWLKINEKGTVDLDHLQRSLSPATALVCLIHTHNETGIIQPIKEAVKIIREKQKQYGNFIHIHCDTVQAAGKSSLNLTVLDVDSAVISGHKVGAPRGVGLLYLKKTLQPLYTGGGQERGLRPGTENLPGIVALAKALENRENRRPKERAAATNLKEFFLHELSQLSSIEIPFLSTVQGESASPYLLSFGILGLPAEVSQRLFADKGIELSAGSACSANAAFYKQKIINPFGFSKSLSTSLLRLSWGATTTQEEGKAVIEELKKIIHENKSLIR